MIFIDTGAFLARTLRRDEHHAAVMANWPRLARERCVTSSLIVAELCTLIERRAGAAAARSVGELLYSDSHLDVLRPTQDHDLAALALMEKLADQRVGFVDAVSFVLMRERRIRRAFAFDRHFVAAGFTLWPRG